MNISLAAEPIFHVGNFPITNSLFTTWIVIALIALFAYKIKSSLKKIPQGLQNLAEFIVESLFDLVESVEKEKAKIFFPIIASFFIFILFNNWSGLIPGVGSIGLWEEKEGHKILVPLFRAGTSDLNTTLALAIISVLSAQYFGIKSLGSKKYLGKFFNFTNPINFFVGILEFIGEFTKIISFAFRLFGNIFAGEVLLLIIAFLVPVLASIPFIGLEIFVGFVQALVFSMLSLVFYSVAISHEEEHA